MIRCSAKKSVIYPPPSHHNTLHPDTAMTIDIAHYVMTPCVKFYGFILSQWMSGPILMTHAANELQMVEGKGGY